MIGILALTAAALFTGAAVYVNVVEQPARLHLDDAALLIEWRPAYQRGTLMQAPLAVIAGAFALYAWWDGGDALFLAGGVAMLANLPYTFAAIMPTNHRLKAIDPAGDTKAGRPLIRRWAVLHAGRSLLGLIGTICFLLAASA